MVYYESVRGCPYRCNFCNYPYLFSDNRFRYKSAARMVEEWEYYLNTLDIEYITCLDSLFTVPRARLAEFCRTLIERRLNGVKWICYARADDLADENTTALMKAAGAHQVQIASSPATRASSITWTRPAPWNRTLARSTCAANTG